MTGRDLGGAAAEVRERLAAQLKLPSGYFFDLAGRVDSQARASRALTIAILAALFGVFLLLNIALGSAVEASLILVTVPIAFVGGILALLAAGETWNVSSLVGLIGLFGIAVQNSLVLVTQSRGLEQDGREIEEAVREASVGRVRPKLMTAGTATLGLLPLLVLRLHGTEIERPLAIVMIGGLVTSTLFTLVRAAGSLPAGAPLASCARGSPRWLLRPWPRRRHDQPRPFARARLRCERSRARVDAGPRAGIHRSRGHRWPGLRLPRAAGGCGPHAVRRGGDWAHAVRDAHRPAGADADADVRLLPGRDPGGPGQWVDPCRHRPRDLRGGRAAATPADRLSRGR